MGAAFVVGILGAILGFFFSGLADGVGTGLAVGIALAALLLGAFLLGGGVAALNEATLNRIRQFLSQVVSGDVSREYLDSIEADLGETGSSLRRAGEMLRGRVGELGQERDKLELTLRHMADGVLVCDSGGTVLLVNNSATRMFDSAEKDLIGRGVSEFAPPVAEGVTAALNGQSVDSEVTVASHGGKAHSYLMRIAPLEDEYSRAVGAVGVFTDVTETRNTERLRKNFVANASHELKTPVAGIQLLSEAIKSEASSLSDDTFSKGRELVTRLQDECTRLARLASDLLELSRVEDPESGRAGTTVSMSELTDRVVSSLSPVANELGVAIKVNGSNEGEVLNVSGDKVGLEIAIFNLVENAIKYNKRGGQVTIDRSTQDAQVSIGVSDTGLGIPDDEIGRIFERFYRVDKARSKETGGTGLGLSIARHIVEQHNGSVSVTSTVGLGTTFTVRLPRGDLV